MYKAKQIDGEWVVVDDSDEIVNSEVDGRISAVAAAARMNREENDSDSTNVKIHRGNSYGNTNDDEDLNEDSGNSNEYEAVLAKDGNPRLHQTKTRIVKFTAVDFDAAKEELRDNLMQDGEYVKSLRQTSGKNMNEDSNYYVSQFDRLKSGPNMEEYAIQIRDNEGNKTNWMTIYKPALNKIKAVMTNLSDPEDQRMNDNGNPQEVKEAFGKEGRISPFDAHQIVSNFDNKDFFELDFDQKDQLSNLMKKYKYRQSKLSGASGRSELRSFYYYLEKLAAKWNKSPNNKNNVTENSEEIDEAIKLYTPDTNVEELDTNELKNYISFIQQKMKEIKDEEEKEKFNAALSRAEEELDEREDNENVDESLNESLISTIYKTIKN